MEKMKAAVMTGIGKISFEERAIPKPKENEVLVKIMHVGICGSDLHYFEHGRIGDFVVDNPMILGHEGGGRVVETGGGVKELKVGDLVALEPGYTCGKCFYCKSGRYNLCEDVVFMATPPYDGAFVEYVAYPADMAFKLPEGMGTLEGALIEPLAVGLHAARQGKAEMGQSAVVLGSGCIGLMTLMSLKAAGITEVFVSDVLDGRLAKARELGASEIFNAADPAFLKHILDITDGQGADMVFETAGNKSATAQTVDLVKRGGRIVLVGMAPEAVIPYDFGRLISKEAVISTVFRYRNLYPAAIKAVAAGLIPVGKVVSHTFKFDDVENALNYSMKNKREVVKGVVAFD